MNGRAVRGGLGLVCFWLAVVGSLRAAEPETGFQSEVHVRKPTRLDWKFVAAGFGKDAARLPLRYDSAGQRYQLFVPPGYKPSRSWPLVVFISPGDEPLGWRFWQKPCQDGEMLFCAAFGAGNNCPPGRRTRIVLDVFDDVRRRYRIDPDRTYLAGFSGGGRMACTIAFSLPECFGGVVPVCGTNPLPRLDYLRHRVRDRLSVAFVTGEKDFNRRENEAYMYPLFKDLGVRTRLWVVPKMGHSVPPAKVLAGVHAWLEEDLARRRADAKTHPGLAAEPAGVLDDRERAARVLGEARAELRKADHTYRGVALLQGVLARWPETDAGDQAKALLKEVREDERRLKLLEEQGGAEERRTLTAQAGALERFGQTQLALKAWGLLVKGHPDTPEGRTAAAAVKRLTDELARTPFLGVSFQGDSTTVASVVAGGPAARAGVRRGDRLVKFGAATIGTLTGLRRALGAHKPGDKVSVEVRRGDKPLTLSLEVGATPPPETK